MNSRGISWVAILFASAGLPATSWAKKCSQDSVQVGDVCVDRYEASVWSTTDTGTIIKIKKGKITAEAQIVGTKRGVGSDDYGAGCPDTGNGCNDYYAISVPATPSAYITWFQAAAACRNAGKRLATNQEWQLAALGTPDPGTVNGTTDCNVDTFEVTGTGSRSSCVSDVGAFDMVGNLQEWVADWVPLSTDCPGWGGFSNDFMCLSGASTTGTGPGALFRGGTFDFGASAGPFYVNGSFPPSGSSGSLGFRCARRL
jgi:hypothetical protein